MRPIKSFLIASALFFFGIFSPLLASININVDAVQKSILLLYAADPNGAVDKTRPIGTGFLVFIPLKSDPKHGYRVLVTARHMLDPTWAKCGIENPSVIYARVNKKSEKFGVEFVRIQLVDQGKPTWVHHADNEVDAAVAQIG